MKIVEMKLPAMEAAKTSALSLKNVFDHFGGDLMGCDKAFDLPLCEPIFAPTSRTDSHNILEMNPSETYKELFTTIVARNVDAYTITTLHN